MLICTQSLYFVFTGSVVGHCGHRAVHVCEGQRDGTLERHGQQTTGAGQAMAPAGIRWHSTGPSMNNMLQTQCHRPPLFQNNGSFFSYLWGGSVFFFSTRLISEYQMELNKVKIKDLLIAYIGEWTLNLITLFWITVLEQLRCLMQEVKIQSSCAIGFSHF